MSTRSVVIVKENNEETWIYHHHDGYPSGVGLDLVQRLKRLEEEFNSESIPTFLRREVESRDIVNNLIKDTEDEYEFTNCIHGDIDYLYVIENLKVKCFHVNFRSNWKNYNEIIRTSEEIDLSTIKED